MYDTYSTWYNVSLEELLVLIFTKKACPFCGYKLKIIKNKEEIMQTDKSWFSSNTYRVTKITYHFHCEKFNKDIKILDLKKKKQS